MPYTTIMLALLQQSPTLYRQLMANKTLLTTLNRSARELKARHVFWSDRLRQEHPESAPQQIASQALELAVREMQDALPDASLPSDPLPELCSLDAAMASLRRPPSPT